MKCPNVGKFSNCKGDLVIKVEEDGVMYYRCPSCGYEHMKYAELFVRSIDLDGISAVIEALKNK